MASFWGQREANHKQNLETRQNAANPFAARLSGVLGGFQASGMTQRQMVEELNTLGIRTAHGGQWSLAQVQRVLKRMAMLK